MPKFIVTPALLDQIAEVISPGWFGDQARLLENYPVQVEGYQASARKRAAVIIDILLNEFEQTMEREKNENCIWS